MKKPVFLDICHLGSFSDIRLARWSLNARFFQLAQVNGINYQIKCLVNGQPIFFDYLCQESDQPLRIQIEVESPAEETDQKSDS